MSSAFGNISCDGHDALHFARFVANDRGRQLDRDRVAGPGKRPADLQYRVVLEATSLYRARESRPMCRAKGFGYDQIEALSNRLGRAVTEKLAGTGVPQANNPPAVSEYNRVGGMFNQRGFQCVCLM